MPQGVTTLGSARQGPWLVDRICAVGELGSDQSAAAKRALIRQAVSKCCSDEDGFLHARHVLRFFATDAAPDEPLRLVSG